MNIFTVTLATFGAMSAFVVLMLVGQWFLDLTSAWFGPAVLMTATITCAVIFVKGVRR